MGQVISFFKKVRPEEFKPVVPTVLIPVEPEPDCCPLCQKEGTYTVWSTCDICASESSS